MKALRWPALWLGLWLALVAAVVVLSLGAPPPAPGVAHGDKGEHLLAYFVLSAAAVQVFRPGAPLLWAAASVVALGVGLEVAQGTLTAERTMDARDAVANTAGVLLGLLTSRAPVRDALLRAVPSGRDR